MIFNKNNGGAQEMKQHIGFIHKSINFANLASYIDFAQRELCRVIGSEVFDQALQHYLSSLFGTSTQGAGPTVVGILDELVERVQLSVALTAYRSYAPGADLSHSDKGRQIFVSEQEKPAFEWQIEKDNENLHRLSSHANEALLEFLEQYIDWPTLEEPLLAWRRSDQFKASRSIFITSARQFDKIIPIGASRLTFLSLVPFIERVQASEIKSCFTPERFEALLAEHLSGQLSAESLTTLEMVRPPLALLSMSMAIKRISSQLLPDGVFRFPMENVIKSNKPAGKGDRNEVAISLEKDGMRELSKLQRFLLGSQIVSAGAEITCEREASIDETLKFVRL